MGDGMGALVLGDRYARALERFSRRAEKGWKPFRLVQGARGLLDALTLQDVLICLAILLLVRPLAGVLSLAKSPVRGRERWLMAFLGIRGIGSIYYVAYGLNHGEFGDSERLWAAVGFLILASIVLHGLTSDTLLRRLATRPGTDQPTR